MMIRSAEIFTISYQLHFTRHSLLMFVKFVLNLCNKRKSQCFTLWLAGRNEFTDKCLHNRKNVQSAVEVLRKERFIQLQHKLGTSQTNDAIATSNYQVDWHFINFHSYCSLTINKVRNSFSGSSISARFVKLRSQ